MQDRQNRSGARRRRTRRLGRRPRGGAGRGGGRLGELADRPFDDHVLDHLDELHRHVVGDRFEGLVEIRGSGDQALELRIEARRNRIGEVLPARGFPGEQILIELDHLELMRRLKLLDLVVDLLNGLELLAWERLFLLQERELALIFLIRRGHHAGELLLRAHLVRRDLAVPDGLLKREPFLEGLHLALDFLLGGL